MGRVDEFKRACNRREANRPVTGCLGYDSYGWKWLRRISA